MAQNVRLWMASQWAFSDVDEGGLDDLNDTVRGGLSDSAYRSITVAPKISKTIYDPDEALEFVHHEGAWTIDELTAQTSIIINCCSSYKLTELLLRSCMKTKTHFLDSLPDRQFLANFSHYDREAKSLIFLF